MRAALLTPPSRRVIPSFDEMLAIYRNWFDFDKSGSQTDLFKKHGWSRLRFFDEASRRRVDV